MRKKQQALLTIKNLPSLINQLKENIRDITNTRNNIASSGKKKNTPPQQGVKENEGIRVG